MTSSLQSAIADLASSFTASVVSAIRGASLQDILNHTQASPAKRGPGRPRGSSAKAKNAKPARTPAPTRIAKGRLQRRSPADIAKALGHVVALVKSNKAGLRSEQIRKRLGLQAKEMPRVLKEGLAKRVLKSKGQKRSTTYSAA
jgi:hypothetical protein